jgi:MobA-like NTP transferase domain
MLAAGLAKRYGGVKPLAPLGTHGDAIIDLTASDAVAAGFQKVVLVLGPRTEPAIGYHVQRCWPEWLSVTTAIQQVPLGTAHAVLCARSALGSEPFAVVNADDVYGTPALSLLAELLAEGRNALVAFRLAETVLGSESVTRGIAQTDAGHHLLGLAERRSVHRRDDGAFVSDDGMEPAVLDPESLVSMNLWGFQPAIWQSIEAAVRGAHPEIGPDGSVEGEPLAPDAEETLLPEVIADAVSCGAISVTVAASAGRCVGVTHADDLPIARAELARMIGRGERAESLWQRR